MLTFTFKDDDASFRGRWAGALPAPEMYLQISYVIPASDAKAGQRFSHTCESIVPARKIPSHDALAGLAQGTAVDLTPAARRWLTQRYLLAPGDRLIPVFGRVGRASLHGLRTAVFLLSYFTTGSTTVLPGYTLCTVIPSPTFPRTFLASLRVGTRQLENA